MSIFIFRRDLRKYDNTGLIHCCEENDIVYPIFIFTPEQIKNNKYKSNNSVQFMIECLKDLNESINNKLNIFYGNYIDVLNEIIGSKKIKIYTNTDYTPYATKRDYELTKNFDTNIYHDICLHEPNTIKNQNNLTYQKFTPYYNKVISMKIKNPKMKEYDNFYKLKKNKYSITWNDLENFYSNNENNYYKGGREKALNKIKQKLNPSEMSAYIKYGCMSIREVYHKFKWNDNLIKQLIWRDFYYDVEYNNIDRFGLPLKEKYEKIKWSEDLTTFKKWCTGTTGFPIIDAHMRFLNRTGFMTNRGRLIVASFLIKNLFHNWTLGEKYFAQKLIDYDPFVNQGNWKWVAGCGTDSQPYYRIFNPWLQSKKYDKNCNFIKSEIPELQTIPSNHIHEWYNYYKNYNTYLIPIIDYNKSKNYVIKQLKKIYTEK